ncbi:hypothetical protein SHIRM173S_10141 [Streptomyces hirsutus]
MAEQLPAYPMTDRTCPYDPPAGLLDLQRQAPLVKVQLPTGPAWLVTSYDAARTLLDDPRMSSDMGREGFPTLYRQKMRPVLKGSFMRMDGEEHAFYRTMLAGEFSVKRVAAMRPEIEQACDQLLDEMIRQGPPANLHESYGIPVSSSSICRFLGVPYEDAEFFTTHLEALFDPHRAGAPERIANSKAALSAYLDELVTRKQKEPGDDMISRLVADYLVPGKVDRPELLLTSYLLLAAGHETTANMITTGTAALLMHPERSPSSGTNRSCCAARWRTPALPQHFPVRHHPHRHRGHTGRRPDRRRGRGHHRLPAARQPRRERLRRPAHPRRRRRGAAPGRPRPAPVRRAHPGPHRAPDRLRAAADPPARFAPGRNGVGDPVPHRDPRFRHHRPARHLG